MPLTERQKKTLRGLGHQLKPVILVGAGGLSPPLLDEFDRSLEHHELMKVKIKLGDRETRDALLDRLCRRSGAELVQRTGNIGLLFRRRRRDSRFSTL
ncbi:MAG: YhbY family RNA-binding protein [Gammaproteobacteria bacterium]|jgi:RNA-binding protein